MLLSPIRPAGPLAVFTAAILFAYPATGAPPQASPEQSVAKPDPSPQFEAEVDRYMKAAVAHDQFSGSILIARNGRPLVSRAYGMASYELQVPNRPETAFQIGSLTKQFTAMAIMQLREHNKLSIADPVCNYVDRCPVGWRPITIRHLLTHTSGVPNYTSLPGWGEELSRKPYDRIELVDLFRNLPLQFKPGEKFRYSNSNYYLLGLVIERASGASFADYVSVNIFAPLGMTRSGYDNGRTLVPGLAEGYDWGQNNFVHAERINMELPYAAGSLYSTTGDLLRWTNALGTERLVSRRAQEEMFTPALEGYGYGWRMGEKFGRRTQAHGGSISGFSSYLLRLPDDDVTVIVLSNSVRTSATKAANNLAAILYRQPYTLPKPQLFDLLSATIQQEGVDRAIAQYRQLKRNRPAEFDFGEDSLNDLGYDLLKAGRTVDAIKIFALNVEAFPQSGGPYDSLGEAYLKAGNREMAIQNYRRSLQLDPDNRNAADVLAKIDRVPTSSGQ